APDDEVVTATFKAALRGRLTAKQCRELGAFCRDLLGAGEPPTPESKIVAEMRCAYNELIASGKLRTSDSQFAKHTVVVARLGWNKDNLPRGASLSNFIERVLHG